LGDQKTQIIKIVLKFIHNDIATIDLEAKSYPSAHSMKDIPSQQALVPKSLQLFLRPILKTGDLGTKLYESLSTSVRGVAIPNGACHSTGP